MNEQPHVNQEVLKKKKTNSSPCTNAGIGYMSHPTLSIAVVVEDALQLKLLHVWFDGLHHLTVGVTAHLVDVAEDLDLLRGLDHTAIHHVCVCMHMYRYM